jgi:hypothetical protein
MKNDKIIEHKKTFQSEMIENTRNMDFDTPFQANFNMTNLNDQIQVTQYKINEL